MQQQNRRPHQSRPSSLANGAKVRFQPLFKLVTVQAIKNLLDGETGHFITWEVLKSTPLMKGIDRKTAKRICDMTQEEFDRECKPARAYILQGDEPFPTYAGLAGACQ